MGNRAGRGSACSIGKLFVLEVGPRWPDREAPAASRRSLLPPRKSGPSRPRRSHLPSTDRPTDRLGRDISTASRSARLRSLASSFVFVSTPCLASDCATTSLQPRGRRAHAQSTTRIVAGNKGMDHQRDRASDVQNHVGVMRQYHPSTLSHSIPPSPDVVSSKTIKAPSKKAKNMKNLSLSTKAAQKFGPTILVSSPIVSEPQSATFARKPPKLPSLNMGLVRQSSLPLLTGKGSPITPMDPTFSLVRELQTESIPETDREGNEIDAYKTGPICVLSPNLWLYSEPTARELRQFDVVINVAKEISNPLAETSSTTAPLVRSHCDSNGGSGSHDTDKQSASDRVCAPARENAASPVDRVSIVSTLHNGIEYVHMPWEHNQALHGDLPVLTSFIDRRINLANKRVLVHCQQGVSRSASLVIAYIMKEKALGVNEAYSYVKNKSSGIGPNMSLIYQLCEWGKTLQRPKASAQRRSFDARGALTAPDSFKTEFNLQQRKRATSVSDRHALERTQSERAICFPTTVDSDPVCPASESLARLRPTCSVVNKKLGPEAACSIESFSLGPRSKSSRMFLGDEDGIV